jgi:hypothetical protein
VVAALRPCSLRNDRKQRHTMKPEPQETENDLGKDQKTFKQLPSKTKELLLLKERAEQSTGKEGLALNQMIRDKSN